jgi:anti-anti-sigma regulatory factor
MKPVFVEVLSGSSEALRAQLVAAAASTLQQGKTTLAIGLDTLRELDDPAIAATIIALRRLRAAGGTVQLVTQRDDHRARLAVTGLDRVFEVFASREEAEGRGGRPHESPAARIRFAIRAAASAVAILLGVVAWPGGARAQAPARFQTDPVAASIVERLAERNAKLKTYEADVKVAVKMTSFPFLRARLSGKTYYKQPDNYEVVFSRVPWYAKGLEHLYAGIGDPATWAQRFVITADGERAVAGRNNELALRMVQRVRGMIDHEEVYVDPVSWTVDELQYHYYNGGTITVRQGFSMIDGFAVVTSQTATIAIPRVRAVASSTFSGFRTNVAIDDAIFVKNQRVGQ